ncbi:MAG: hypothetical protein E7172_06635 [Firmicutes bacterium]|nr:hypothetical protein [Bacillota bacterium]
MSDRRYIIHYVVEIVYTSLFLIVSTYLWFVVKDRNVEALEFQKENILVSDSIAFNYLEQVSDNEISELENYSFNIQNTGTNEENIKIYVVSDIASNTISNNYIKYQINDGRIKSLNMDGVIYIDNIEALESKDFTLKLWISDTYSGNLNYNGRVIVA